MHTKVGSQALSASGREEENQEIQTAAFDAVAAAGAGEEEVEITGTLEDRLEDCGAVQRLMALLLWNSAGRRPLSHTLARPAAPHHQKNSPL